MAYRICEKCGRNHLQTNSPLCNTCRKAASKHKCSIDGCETMIGPESLTCLNHRHLQKGITYSHCRECGDELPKPSVLGVCKACYQSTRVLCACGCGRYRRKYGPFGQVYQYVSGHNDNWVENRRPLVKCAVCGKDFKAENKRARLCGIECRTKWLTLNPPNERKRILCHCAVCGKEMYRAPYQMRSQDYACSRKCQSILVAGKNTGIKTDARKLAAQRGGWKCRICGFDVLVEVHHIQPKRRNGGGGTNGLDNLITLCPNHHTMADRGLIDENELRGKIAAVA